MNDGNFAGAAATSAAHYRKDGYLLVPRLFDPERTRLIRDGVAAAIGEDLGPSGVRVFDAGETPDVLLAACTSVEIRTVLRTIIGDSIEFLSVKPVIKGGRITTASPWHQDWAYWKGATKHSVWIALDPARADNGCLRVVPASHAEAWEHRRHTGPDGFGNRIDDEAVVARFGADAIVTVEMEPGDALFFHDLLLHSSHPNTSGRDRWSLIPTYRNAAVPDDHNLRPIWKSPISM